MKNWPVVDRIDAERLLPSLDRAKATAGKNMLHQYLNNGKIGRADAVVAKCCECMAYYEDGLKDCQNTICPLYPWMPYRRG